MVKAFSQGPELEWTGDDPRDAVEALLRAAREFPAAGVRTPQGLLTYPALSARARRILTGLRERGPGDHVILAGLPLAEFFPAFWACVLGGLRPVAIAEPPAPGPALERLRHTWNLLDRPMVVTDTAGVAALRALDGPSAVDVADCVREKETVAVHRPAESDVALLILSSGSTGAPKAAQLTHRALAEFAAGTRRMIDLRPGQSTLNWLPVDHSGAFLFYHVLPVFAGCTNAHLPTEDVVADPLRWLDELAGHRVEHTWAPTFGYQLVADAVAGTDRTWDLTAVRTLVCGGEQVTLPVVDRFFAATARFGLSTEAFRPVWGMAETTTAITVGPLRTWHVRTDSLGGELVWTDRDAPGSTTFVGVGRPAPGAAVQVVDRDGQVLPEGRIGRLLVRSNRVTAGYANNPDATAQALPDGEWLVTGDLAFVHDGEVVITGREKDVIILNGHNVLCHEIEQVAGEVDGVPVAGAGACAVPNPRTGTDDLVVFFEDVAGDATRVERDIRQALFTRLRLTPARVVAVPAGRFPRTASGKVRRAALRELPEQAVDVRAVVEDLLGERVDDHTPFYELGLSSVTLVRLRARLEELTGRTIATTVLFEHPTVAALTGYLAGEHPDPPAEATESTSDTRVAVIGMAARLPGAADIDQFWANLRDGVDSVSVFGPADPSRVPVGGVLDEVDLFDAAFFGMTAREAELTEPAHRLFLECAYRALEHSGYPSTEPETRVGVFAGSGMNLYGHQDRLAPVADVPSAMQATIGAEPDFLASRVAYRLGLTGPAIGVQTACSTSLVAVHLAVRALLDDDADLAVAGAAAVRVPQDSGYQAFPGSILSPTGRCRPFDAEADGTVGGNGVAAVVLKRLDRALADGDTVHAVILGSAVNNDGRGKVGFAAPSVRGQVEVVRQALRRAGVPAGTIGYVEAHGTGTPLGDPVEFEALSRALGTRGRGVCTLGSVKGNIGHLDSCAGLAGLIKAVLMLRHGELVPTLNLATPNPRLALAGSPFVLGAERRPWRTEDGLPRRAGVSALGVGGTNAHVILEEPPARRPVPAGTPVVAPISAHTTEALGELAARLRAHLLAHPELSTVDVAATLAGRPRLPVRHAVTGRTAAELAGALAGPVEPAAPGPVVFAFSGQGTPVGAAARELYERFPVARPVLSAYDGDGTQPALFVFQAALVEVWRSLGVRPDVVVGHSVGEYAALYAAGALSLEEGLRLTTVRDELMASTPPGGMVAVFADRARAEGVARATGTEVAVVNGPAAFVLAGDTAAVERAVEVLEREELVWRRLAAERAFHTSLIDPVLDPLRAACARAELGSPRIPVVSGVDGTRLHAVDAEYLCRHARRPVRFDQALAGLAAAGLFVEIGPGRALSGLGGRALPGSRWVPSWGAERAFHRALAEVYRQGVDVDWTAVSTGGRLPLPGYPLDRRPIARPTAQPIAQPIAQPTPVTPAIAPVAAPATDVVERIRLLTAGQLGMRVEEVLADASFVDLGADSLTLMNLVRVADEELGVRVPVRELFADLDTPRKLAARITAAAPPAPPAIVESPDIHTLVERQVRLTEQVTALVARQLDLLAAAGPSLAAAQLTPEAAQPSSAAPLSPTARSAEDAAGGCDFSLYFFGDYPDRAERDKYRLILDAAEFADEHGFHAVWLPERHFDAFGALFPNPSVLAAALATRTSRVRLHAGSVVLPLHHPIRVAEEWSVVDNLSGGRAGMCFAPGWHARDFVLAPDNFGRHRDELYTQLDTVRRLWAGEAVEATAGNGEPVPVRLHPNPLQDRPPMFVAILGNPDSYRRAAEQDLGVVTNLMSQSIEDLSANVALYRRTRAEHGLDPAAGRVVVLAHTYLGADAEQARAEAFTPFCDYLRSSLSLFGQVTNSLGVRIDLEHTPADDVEFLLAQAYRRYCESRALIGTVDSCGAVVDGLLAAGADEIACFVDFGVARESVLAALPTLDSLRRRHAAGRPRPVSPAQRRMWFLEKLAPGTTNYLEPKAISLSGPLDVEALLGSLRRVVARQPALRTVFRELDGEPHAVVLPGVDVACPLTDAEGADVAEALDDLMATRRPFDLATGPLLALRLLRFSAEHHVLFVLAHHIVFDSTSTVLFARDLAAYYRAWPARPDLPPVAAPAAPPAAPAEHLDFWRDHLAGAAELRLPTDRPRPATRSGSGAHVVHELDADLAEELRVFARRQRTSVFTTLLTALGAVLSRFSGQDDFVLGTAVAGRPPAAADTIGMFVDTVPVRVDLTGDPGFADALTRLTASTMDCLDHRGVPFDELVAALNPDREPGRNPLFGVAVEYENAGTVEFDPPRLSAELVDLPSDRAPMDLILYLTHHAAGVRCVVEYDTDLFDERTVRRLLAYLEHVLAVVTREPARRVGDLGLIDDDARLLAGWEGTAGPASALCLHDLFERQADATPGAVALTGLDGDLTYRELDERANGIARDLLAAGVARGELVGVCTSRGHDLISALLGVLKSGAGFLALDPALPAERLEFMLADAGVTTVVTDHGAPSFGARRTVPAGSTPCAERPQRTVDPDDLAYCIYTSGSTGRPKGVLVPHRGPVNLVGWHVDRHPPTRTLQWASPAFDANIYEIFTTLASGAALVLVDDRVRYDPDAVAEVIRDHAVERICMPFTPLRLLLEGRSGLPSLREILSGGEPTRPTPAVHEFLAAHPDCVLYNGYGPTEGSVAAAVHRVAPGDSTPPIGRPIEGFRITLLDRDRRPVPVGAVGEIYLSGPGVANGYLNRPAETAAAFVEPGTYRTGDLGRWRADGTLEFLGRTDAQVKIRGLRIEPGEIRHALLGVPGVRDAAVAVHADELVGYVVTDLDPASVGETLARSLPAHLVPRRWVRLDALPLTPSGKLDHAGLPAPVAAAHTPPGTPTERSLHALWCAELAVREAGVDESFFELGGHSLTVARLLNKVREQWGVEYPMAEFFRRPTIRGMAAVLDGVESAPLTCAQRRLWHRHHARTDPSIYNGLSVVDIEGELDPDRLRHALDSLVRRHAALRTRVFATHQEVVAPFAVDLVEVDLAADEVAQWSVDLARPAFDLTVAPLFRVGLARITGRRWALAVVVHHMIFDGWSAKLFWQELTASYDGAELAAAPTQYPDYARWEQAALRDRDELAAFWRAELAGATVTSGLPADRPRPEALSGRGATWHASMPAQTVRARAATAGTTPYLVIAEAFADWLAATTGREDVVLAASSARRTRAEHENMIGYVGEAVLVRTRPGADLAERLYTALDHQALPLSEVVRLAIPAEAATPYPAVLFTVVTDPQGTVSLGEATGRIRGRTVPGLARTELYVVFTLGSDVLELDIEYATDLFEEHTISSWAAEIMRGLGWARLRRVA